MVEKIYITPGNVRGLGNIVSLKSAMDFEGNYSNLIVDSEGNFVLSYEGLLLKFQTSVSHTIIGSLASLTCTVLLEEDNTPVSDLIVTCTFEDETVLTETTDSEGKVTFNWTPSSIGDTTITLACTKQESYAAHTSSIDVTIGLWLSLNLLMTDLNVEYDDEVYVGTFENPVEHRSQLAPYIKDIFVADGGERCVDMSGLVYVASPGELVVEYDELDQLPGYEAVLFEDEVDDLTNAVVGMGVTDDNDIVLTCLERADIVSEGPSVGSVSLVASKSSIRMNNDYAVLSATVLDEDDEPLEDVTVQFYEDNVLIGSSFSSSSGVASFDYYPSIAGKHTLTAKAGGVISSDVSVTANKITARITQFNVSSSTPYVGESVTVSMNTSLPSSCPIKIMADDTVLATVYSNGSSAQGTVSFSSQGSYSLKAVFEGDNVWNAVESDSVSVTVSKLTPTLSLSSSASSVTLGDSFTLSGTLSVGSGQSVLLYRNDHYLKTLTTGSNGAFSETITEASAGSYSYYVLFESTSVYSRVQSSTVSVSVSDVAPSYDGVEVSSDKSVLSYYDSDSCTLSAQLMDGTSTASVSGETVTFYADGVSLGTAVTDSNGVATKTYNSTGSGDVVITASVGTLVSETYIEDCYLYTTEEYSRTHTSSSPVSNTVISDFSWDNTTDWEFSCDFKASGYGQRIDIVPPSESLNHHIGFGKSTDNNYMRYYFGKSSSGENNITTSKTVTNGTYYPVTVKKIGTSITWTFENEETSNPYDSTWLSNYSLETFKFTQWRATSIYVKNIKIKPL